MDLNFIARLLGGAASAGAPAPAPAAPGAPVNLLAGIPGYGAPTPPPAAAPTNLLQSLNMGAPANAAPALQAPPAATAAPRERRSILDTVGRLADVFAKVGGADALYQPTLDARQDRGFAIEDRARGIDMDKLKQELAGQQVQAGEGALGDAENGRVVQAARGIEALRRANPQTDIARVVPLLFKQAGVSEERAAALTEAIGQNPDLLSALIAGDGESEKYGGSIVYGKDANGKLVAFQPGLSGNGGRNVLPEGITPIDPQKFVDVGNAQVGVGTRSGTVGTTLAKGEAPGRALDRGSRERIAAGGNATRIQVAGMRPAAGAKGATAEAATASRENARATLSELRGIYGKLNKSGALVNPSNGAGGNIVARVRASGIGQLAEGAVGTEAQTLRDRVASIRPGLMQTLAKATGMTGKQLDSNADVKLFMQTVTDPTKSYQANIAAINGLERFLASSGGAAKPAPRRAAPAPARRPAGKPGKPSVTNW